MLAPRAPQMERPAPQNWLLQLSMYHPLTEVMSYVILAMGATMLALKLSGVTLSGNTDTASDGTTAGWWYIAGTLCAGHFLCAGVNFVAYRHWHASPTPRHPILRCIRMRGICEAAYSGLQHVGLFLVVARLPAYIADAVRRAAAGGAELGSLSGVTTNDESEPLGIHTNEGAPVSINAIMGPLWAAWIAQECVSIFFDAGRSVVPDIENEELQHQLALLLKSIRIRPRVKCFVFNVQLTFCARMIDNAYRVSWKALFIIEWLTFGFMLCSLCYIIAALLVGTFREGLQETTTIYRRLLCSSVVTVLASICTIAPVCCNFIFALNLSRRLDGDESINEISILLPFIIGQFAAATMVCLSMNLPSETRNAAIAASGLGLPMGPFSDMLDNTALLSQQLQERGTALVAGILAAATATAENRDRGMLEAERRRREEQVRQYEANAPTELLRQLDDGSALYRTRADVGNSNNTAQDKTLSDVEGGLEDRMTDSLTQAGSATNSASTVEGRGTLNSIGHGLADSAETSCSRRSSPDCPPTFSFGACQICFEDGPDAIANTVLLPCGHGGLCRTCGMTIAMKPPHFCHMCRGIVLKVATVEPHEFDQDTGLLQFKVASSTSALSVRGGAEVARP